VYFDVKLYMQANIEVNKKVAINVNKGMTISKKIFMLKSSVDTLTIKSYVTFTSTPNTKHQ
jgi:hypothetical protein